jgi:2-iminobutanoate/2-iminopropanoate deaminase
MKRIFLGLFAILILSSSIFAQKVNKKSLGADIVPAGTLYSPGIIVDNTLYVSGLQGIDARTHELPNDFSQEVRNSLDNIGRVLKQAGMGYSNVVSVQIFLVDMSQFQEVNSIYKAYFKTPFPSRTTVQVSKLSLGARIEIAAVAHK